jgi:hypothetical protein
MVAFGSSDFRKLGLFRSFNRYCSLVAAGSLAASGSTGSAYSHPMSNFRPAFSAGPVFGMPRFAPSPTGTYADTPTSPCQFLTNSYKKLTCASLASPHPPPPTATNHHSPITSHFSRRLAPWHVFRSVTCHGLRSTSRSRLQYG